MAASKKIKHVAIIMDGNGRWAQRRMRPRVWGHVRGSHTVSRIVEKADELRLSSLTLYAFSTENWSRPAEEISFLLKILKKFLQRERKRILANNIRFQVIGQREKLPRELQEIVADLEEETNSATGLLLNFAFSYGSQMEIVRAVNQFIAEKPGELITEKEIQKRFYLPEVPQVDLLIRTGGEQRISNFLLWQLAYSELYFTDTMWPNFSREEFEQIYHLVSLRERRFGSIDKDTTYEKVKQYTEKHEPIIQDKIL